MRLIDADALSEKLCKTTIFVKDGEVFQRMVNDAPTVSAEAEQVTGKLKKPCDSLLISDSDECKEQKSKLQSAGDTFCKSQLITCNRVKECNGVCPFEDALKHADKEMDEQNVIDHDRDWIIGCLQHDGFIHTHRFDKANQIILDALSAEAVQGWIPVEEQPPVFPCLVCDANGNQPSVPLGIVTITDEEHGEWHIDGRLWDTKIFFKGEWCSQTGYGNRIIAWMPLPEPYKGGDEA